MPLKNFCKQRILELRIYLLRTVAESACRTKPYIYFRNNHLKQQQQVIPVRAVAVLFILEDDAFIQHDLVYFAQVFQPPISTTKAINFELVLAD